MVFRGELYFIVFLPLTITQYLFVNMVRRIFLLLSLLLLFSLSQAELVTKLVYVQTLLRHGAIYPKDPDSLNKSVVYIPENMAKKLTQQGKAIPYELGHILYEEYWKALFGKDNNYFNQDKFYFRSTGSARAIQSLQSLVQGMIEGTRPVVMSIKDMRHKYPPWPQIDRTVKPTEQRQIVYTHSPQFHPFPIDIVQTKMTPYTEGDFLKYYTPEGCPNQEKWSKQNFKKPEALKVKNDLYITKETLDFLSIIEGKPMQFSGDLFGALSDAQSLQFLESQPFKNIKHNDNINQHLASLYCMIGHILKTLDRTQLRATTTAFFNKTIHDIKAAIKDQSGMQWAIYSGHGSNVIMIATALGLTNLNCVYQNFLNKTYFNNQTQYCLVQFPVFSSTVNFQIYKHPGGAHTFKVKYNGEYRRLPQCEWGYECNVENLYRWYDSWKDQNYRHTCGVNKAPKLKNKLRRHQIHGP